MQNRPSYLSVRFCDFGLTMGKPQSKHKFIYIIHIYIIFSDTNDTTFRFTWFRHQEQSSLGNPSRAELRLFYSISHSTFIQTTV